MNIDSLSLDELYGVVSLYPWFAIARKKLIMKTFQPGDEPGWESIYSEAAMYLPDKQSFFAALRSKSSFDFTDKDVKDLLKSYTKPKTVRAGAGDFFSQEDYDNAPQAEYFDFRHLSNLSATDASSVSDDQFNDFCTETLAEIFLEQGYPNQAKSIYSKLILQNPEKSAYFASLIEKIDQTTNN